MMQRIACVARSLLLLAGWLIFVNTDEMKITRELKAPMHIHEFNLNEAADRSTPSATASSSDSICRPNLAAPHPIV